MGQARAGDLQQSGARAATRSGFAAVSATPLVVRVRRAAAAPAAKIVHDQPRVSVPVQLLLQSFARRPLRFELEEGADPQPRERDRGARSRTPRWPTASDWVSRKHLRLQYEVAARVRRAVPS